MIDVFLSWLNQLLDMPVVLRRQRRGGNLTLRFAIGRPPFLYRRSVTNGTQAVLTGSGTDTEI